MIRERYGKTPVRHLADLDLLDENTIAAHCIWLDENELDLLAEHKVKVAHDPESNMKFGAGVAPVPAMLSRGIAVGLGTDGCASNNDLDLFGEMRMAAMLHKVFSADPTVMTAEKVVEMATSGGARVLGMEDRIGSIIPGKEADIILVEYEKAAPNAPIQPLLPPRLCGLGRRRGHEHYRGKDRHEGPPPPSAQPGGNHAGGPPDR